MLVQGGLFASTAYAQDTGTTTESTETQNQDQSTAGAPEAGTQAPAVPVQNTNEGANSDQEEIVVTGTLFRRTNTETPSPVTVLSSESLARRGITNVNDAVRSISADNAGSIPSSFTNGFGGGGAAAALRGLTVNSTLTLVDGLRMVNYPLADDGQRAFVDLNTIPRVAIERIEVLKDGASSTYGADAIGGVVNIITRKQFQGVDATVEAGITQRGDGENFRATILGGMGDYDDRGFNMYAGLEFATNKPIFTRDRGFPFNTGDLVDQGGTNVNWLPFGFLTSSMGPVAVVAPANQTDPTNPLSGIQIPGATVIINPAQCDAFGGTIVTGLAGFGGGESCEVNQFNSDFVRLTIQPKTTRWGGTVRASVRVTDNAEAYLMGSFYRNEAEIYPAFARTRSTNPVVTTGLVLPVHLSDGSVNPYNPFANANCDPLLDGDTAAGGCAAALIRFRFPNLDRKANLENNVFRGAAGINGSFGEGWRYQVDVGAMTSNLHRKSTGNVHIPTLLQVINDGSYNFADPLATDPAVVDALLRTVETSSNAQLYLAQGFISKDVTELAGGPLQVGVGAQIRREELDNPNQNPANEFIDVNQVFARGQRTVKAGFFEIAAPVLDMLELNVSGRYDDYSTGFSNFSPKAGFKFTPIRQIALRGTYSKGFRAPSFAESGDAGVIGFVTATPPCVVRLQHGATDNGDGTCTAGNSYVGPQALGFNSAANPDLKPEKSRSFTLGLVAQPIQDLSFTVDYYNIKKTDVITQGPLSNLALANFYNGLPLPDGYSVQTYPVDPAFPAATPVVSIINSPYENAANIKTSGIDGSILYQHRFSPSVRFSSQLEVTKILKFDFQPEDGAPVQHYAGTLGPYQLSSGAGTPDWRGNWSNSLDIGRATITGTAYYVGSYWDYAEDTSTDITADKCVQADETYSSAFCKTKKFIWVDLVGSYKLTDNVTIFGNVLNLFDARAPIEPANYAGPQANYNPTWHQAGAVGRAFRIGANFSFRPHPAMAPVEPAPLPPPPPPAPPATQTCPDGSVILATDVCPPPPPPPPPPAPAPEPERG